VTALFADGTARCPLCLRTHRITKAGRLFRHADLEGLVTEHPSSRCRASGLTLADADDMARRELDGLEALRARAHP
jgi:hypothetical protein